LIISTNAAAAAGHNESDTRDTIHAAEPAAIANDAMERATPATTRGPRVSS
jgi:hypothetical protein